MQHLSQNCVSLYHHGLGWKFAVLAMHTHPFWLGKKPASPLTCLFPQSKARKLRSKGRGKADLLKKNLEDKIRLFEERAPVELADQVGLGSLTPPPHLSHPNTQHTVHPLLKYAVQACWHSTARNHVQEHSQGTLSLYPQGTQVGVMVGFCILS